MLRYAVLLYFPICAGFASVQIPLNVGLLWESVCVNDSIVSVTNVKIKRLTWVVFLPGAFHSSYWPMFRTSSLPLASEEILSAQ